MSPASNDPIAAHLGLMESAREAHSYIDSLVDGCRHVDTMDPAVQNVAVLGIAVDLQRVSRAASRVGAEAAIITARATSKLAPFQPAAAVLLEEAQAALDRALYPEAITLAASVFALGTQSARETLQAAIERRAAQGQEAEQ